MHNDTVGPPADTFHPVPVTNHGLKGAKHLNERTVDLAKPGAPGKDGDGPGPASDVAGGVACVSWVSDNFIKRRAPPRDR